MAKYYYYLTNYHHRHRHIKRLKRTIATLIVVVLVVGGGVAIDLIRTHSQRKSVVSQQSTVIQQSPISVLRSAYFQFQAPSTWEEVAGNGVGGKYSYRNFDNSQIKQQLDVYVNAQPDPFTAEYVIPVIVSADGRLTATQISDHCKNGAPAGNKDASRPMVYQGISFNCHVDGTDYTVLAGIKGGTPILKLRRADKTYASYIIVYRDLTAYPGPGQLSQILTSFQAL